MQKRIDTNEIRRYSLEEKGVIVRQTESHPKPIAMDSARRKMIRL
jgi:hypothetical protein